MENTKKHIPCSIDSRSKGPLCYNNIRRSLMMSKSSLILSNNQNSNTVIIVILHWNLTLNRKKKDNSFLK